MDQHSGRPDEEPAAPAEPVDLGPRNSGHGDAGPAAGQRPPLPVRPVGRAAPANPPAPAPGSELELAPRRELDVRGAHAGAAADETDEDAGGTAGSTADGAGGGTGEAGGASDGFDAFGIGRPASSSLAIPEPRLPEAVERALHAEPFDAFGTGRGASGRASGERSPGSGGASGSAAGAFAAGARSALPGSGGPGAGRGPIGSRLGSGSGSFDGFAAGSPGARRTPRALPVRGDGSDTGFGAGEEPAASAGAAPVHEPAVHEPAAHEPAAHEPAAHEPAADETAFGDVAFDDAAFDDPQAAVDAARTARPARDPLGPPEIGASGANARVRRIVTTDFLVTVNPVDGSEVVPCPPEEFRTPARRSAEERAARMNAARPAPPPGPPAPELPLLERQEECERLVRLLSRGRTVRVTGPSGCGRTALLDSVAGACGGLAPEGVLRLSGYHRTAHDLMHELYALVYAGDDYRPSPAELTRLLADVGAVVILDDLEFGGSALDDLLAAAPECAFLLAATPDVAAPTAESGIEEVALAGLSRAACLDLLVLAAGRPLADDETAWAADLWFESEGLPLRFVQAGALLRQRDALRQPAAEPADWEDSVWEKGAPQAAPAPALPDLSAFDGVPGFEGAAGFGDGAFGAAGDAGTDGGFGAGAGTGFDLGPDDGFGFDGAGGGAGDGAGRAAGGFAAGTGSDGMLSIPLGGSAAAARRDVPGEPPAVPAHPQAAAAPLPSLAESAAPAELLATRLGESAREALAFAVALDGECPHPSHLPALVGDTHGDAALGELTAVGLAVPVAGHFRLAAGVAHQLAAVLRTDGELTEVQAHTAALHYAWWTGHRSVTPERAAREAEAILAAMAACGHGGNPGAAVLLARTVAPVFAAALHWGAWERALRIGQEAARLTGEVAEEAYFLHELGVLALCTGRYDLARAELEASIALRGALADRQGTAAGRRALALVPDRGTYESATTLSEVLVPYGRPGDVDDITAQLPPALNAPAPVTISKPAGGGTAPARHGRPAPTGLRRLTATNSRRNLIVASTGALLVAAVGAIVAFGGGSKSGSPGNNQVQPIESVQQDDPTDTTEPPTTTTTPPTTSASPSPSTSASTTATTPTPTLPAGGPTSPSATRTTPTTPPTTSGGGPTSVSKPPTKATTPPTKSTPPTTPPTTTPPPTTSPPAASTQSATAPGSAPTSTSASPTGTSTSSASPTDTSTSTSPSATDSPSTSAS